MVDRCPVDIPVIYLRVVQNYITCTYGFSGFKECIQGIICHLNEPELVVTDHEFIACSTKSVEERTSAQITVESVDK